MSDKQIQTVKGIVVKKGSTQTIKVAVKVTKVHPIYKKRYSQTRHYIAHDESDAVKVGDNVTIVACRPISKIKHWTVA
ncbi:MAG TPA: 30S ribosomal protein S17 [Verrucomicrobiae bacterium]|nr:30S ribosomal protein S17 [Verrucomicrobiae bacterium]